MPSELRGLMERSRPLLAASADNQERRPPRRIARDADVAVGAWEKRRQLEPFRQRFGKTGAVITAVDLLRGLARLLGWQVIDVPGATGYLDTDYAAKGRYAIDSAE